MENFSTDTETEEIVAVEITGQYIDGNKKIRIKATNTSSGVLALDPAHDTRKFFCLNHPSNPQDEIIRVKEVVLFLVPENGLPTKLEVDYSIDPADATNEVEVSSFVLVDQTKSNEDEVSPNKPKFILVRSA